MKKIINWFKQSNRYKHLYMGLLIWIFYIIIILLLGISIMPATIVGSISSITHMITAEYKDKLKGGLFDKNDIIAGSIIPVILTLVIIIISLFV